jgi:hypothetical protein
MITRSTKILQAARVDDLRSSAERLASVVRQPAKIRLPRTSRHQRRLVLWLLARDRRRTESLIELLE